jgi:hypothetical protein
VVKEREFWPWWQGETVCLKVTSAEGTCMIPGYGKTAYSGAVKSKHKRLRKWENSIYIIMVYFCQVI